MPRGLQGPADWDATLRCFSRPIPTGAGDTFEAGLTREPMARLGGVCVVRLREGRIFRSEVYFDRSVLLHHQPERFSGSDPRGRVTAKRS